jgi:hypothetical protein
MPGLPQEPQQGSTIAKTTLSHVDERDMMTALNAA